MTKLNNDWLAEHNEIIFVLLGIIIGSSIGMTYMVIDSEYLNKNDILENKYNQLKSICNEQGYDSVWDFSYNQYEEDYLLRCTNWWHNVTHTYLLNGELGL